MSHAEYMHIGSTKTKLTEEIGELIVAISKAERFGLFNSHPMRPDSNNYKELMMEIDDVELWLKEYRKELIELKHSKMN